MKSALILALVIGLGVMFFFYRRRLRLAILVAGSLYLVIIAVRLIAFQDDADRFTELAAALGLMGLVWLAVNLLTSLIERRRRIRR